MCDANHMLRLGASWLGAVGMIATCVAAAPATSVETQEAPLESFASLVLGRWEADGSRHHFTWGVGRQVLHSRSWFADGDEWTLVSEGWWYWDPAERTIRGQTVAVGMGIDLFEYRSRIDGQVVVHDLVSHGDFGGVYVERWTFDAEGYDWALEQDGAPVMGGRYQRPTAPWLDIGVPPSVR